MRQKGHDALPTFGVGREYDKRQWQAVFRQMMGHDLIRPDPERHGALRMTDDALPILKGEASINQADVQQALLCVGMYLGETLRLARCWIDFSRPRLPSWSRSDAPTAQPEHPEILIC